MRIAHISDTHLGCTGPGIQRDVPDPFRKGYFIKQQEANIFTGFVSAIDRIIDKIKPSVVIHSGDLFDSSLPKAATLDFAMGQFVRLFQAGIPSIVVEGDHSSPRTRGNGNIVQMLRYLPGVTVIAPGQDKISIGSLTIHAVSHQALEKTDLPVLNHQLDAGQRNVLVAHGVADGHRLFKTHKMAFRVAVERVAHWFDYVALGHCHRFAQVPGTENAFYAGATALVSPLDFHPGYEFGFNVISFTDNGIKVEREIVPNPSMCHYGLDNASGLSAKEILNYLCQQASAVDCRNTYCRVVVKNVDALARRELSFRIVEEIFPQTVAIDVKLHPKEIRWEATAAAQGLVNGGSLESRFGELVEQMDGDDGFKAKVLASGKSFLDAAADKVMEASVKEDRDA